MTDKKPTKRPGEKRLTLALDGETYKRLRLRAAETDQTHQAILEAALAYYLKREEAAKAAKLAKELEWREPRLQWRESK